MLYAVEHDALGSVVRFPPGGAGVGDKLRHDFDHPCIITSMLSGALQDCLEQGNTTALGVIGGSGSCALDLVFDVLLKQGQYLVAVPIAVLLDPKPVFVL